MLLITQNTCHSGHIVVIHKRQQVFSLIQCPVLRSELTQQGMHDLKHIHAIEAAVKSLITLVVRCGMQHLIIHQAIIISVKHLA